MARKSRSRTKKSSKKSGSSKRHSNPRVQKKARKSKSSKSIKSASHAFSTEDKQDVKDLLFPRIGSNLYFPSSENVATLKYACRDVFQVPASAFFSFGFTINFSLLPSQIFTDGALTVTAIEYRNFILAITCPSGAMNVMFPTGNNGPNPISYVAGTVATAGFNTKFNGRRARMISATVLIRYVGDGDKNGGRMTIAQYPASLDDIGEVTYMKDYNSNAVVQTYVNTRDGASIVIIPINESYKEFIGGNNLQVGMNGGAVKLLYTESRLPVGAGVQPVVQYGSSVPSAYSWPLLTCLGTTGVASTGAVLEVEILRYCEAVVGIGDVDLNLGSVNSHAQQHALEVEHLLNDVRMNHAANGGNMTPIGPGDSSYIDSLKSNLLPYLATLVVGPALTYGLYKSGFGTKTSYTPYEQSHMTGSAWGPLHGSQFRSIIGDNNV